MQEKERTSEHAPSLPDDVALAAAIDQAFAVATRAAVARTRAQGRATRGMIAGRRVEIAPSAKVRALAKTSARRER